MGLTAGEDCLIFAVFCCSLSVLYHSVHVFTACGLTRHIALAQHMVCIGVNRAGSQEEPPSGANKGAGQIGSQKKKGSEHCKLERKYV